jgi:hypothetical protein
MEAARPTDRAALYTGKMARRARQDRCSMETPLPSTDGAVPSSVTHPGLVGALED